MSASKEKIKEYLERHYKTEKYKNTKRIYKYMSLYGISLEQFNDMYTKQKGVCAICKKPETCLTRSGKTKQLSVDHCHTTKKVRGLLCNSCNNLIGRSKDDMDVLTNAVSYLKNYNEVNKL